jgi:hypothetical protein
MPAFQAHMVRVLGGTIHHVAKAVGSGMMLGLVRTASAFESALR